MRTSIYQPTRNASTAEDVKSRSNAPNNVHPVNVLPGTETRTSTTKAHEQAEAEKGVGSKRAKVFHSAQDATTSAVSLSQNLTPSVAAAKDGAAEAGDVEEGDFPFSEHQVRKTALHICAELKEENEYMITMVCQTIGNEEANKLLKETQDIEAQGGMMAQDKSKRKAPGGVFLALVKKKIGRFEFNELSREANRERKRLKAALRVAEGASPSPPSTQQKTS